MVRRMIYNFSQVAFITTSLIILAPCSLNIIAEYLITHKKKCTRHSALDETYAKGSSWFHRNT